MMPILLQCFELIEGSPIYTAMLAYFGLYPIITSLVWMISALVYFKRRDRQPAQRDDSDSPFVSIVIPAYCEEQMIGEALAGALRLDYPSFEIIVIDDGSTDRTAERVKPFLRDPRVRLISKSVNEGKAMGLNDALPCMRGELFVIMDADAIPDRMMLRHLVPHFRSARVGAVAGNPRVRNRNSILAKLQAVEFSSVIGLMRRAQRTWGRVMCVSGVVGMYRKSAVLDAGALTPGMATEDIDLTWKLQMRMYDVRYEPQALVWMLVPDNMILWWKQRRRWARGLGQVLRRHNAVMRSWKYRRMMPLYVESMLSVLWALVFLSVTTFWTLSYALGHPPRGGSPIPNLWGMLLFTVCLAQLLCGVLIDRRYERGALADSLVSVLYPSFYWALLAFTSSLYTLPSLVRTIRVNSPTKWRIEHVYNQP
jgi:biofilm PGA synthesis N-glycosyltransferase PgaC